MSLRAWEDSAIPDIARMPAETYDLLQILRRHIGRADAIGMLQLYEEWSGERLARDVMGKCTEDAPTKSRRMRLLIDDLRDIYGVPVMSSTQRGYWIIGDDAELQEVVNQFKARGLKSLTTAARLKKISLVDELRQIEIDLSTKPGGA